MVLGYFLAVEGLEKGYIPALHEAVQFVFLTPTSGVFWSFWLLVIFGIAIPIIIVLNPKTGYDLRWITFAGILHAALVFAERFYLIIPGQVFPEEYLPGYELESLHTLEGSYTPSVFEWLQVIGLIAMVYLIFVVGVKLFALIPERAVEEVVEE